MQGSEYSSSPILPTTRAQEPGSTSPGYGDSLNDFANRAINGVAPKDLLRSPAASEAERGHQPEAVAKARGGQVTLSGQFLPTPNTMDGLPPREGKAREKQLKRGGDSKRESSGNLREDVIHRIEGINWGKFEPAIKRWEAVLGRPAPAPTKPDGKENAYRLSSKFTEWMMGLPEGWITDVGLSRNDELKACGNGVVPQQAELALAILLEEIEIKPGGGK